ncbi:DUF3291 domain-containing protein [Pseudonocardia sp. HH130629-09]|uniref:DUF3291 domain-containing protein n=1 Tax=Pseudonocardia sp. HH130629-09 TaxID=1641402 RepID=UPI0009E9781D
MRRGSGVRALSSGDALATSRRLSATCHSPARAQDMIMRGAPCGGHRPCRTSLISERCRVRAEPDGCGSSGVASWAVCSLASGFVSDWEIAQVNIALPVVPLSEPRTRVVRRGPRPGERCGRRRARVPVGHADRDGDAAAVRAFGDDRPIVNMSVWASVEALADFVYRDPAHVAVLRRKRESFVPRSGTMSLFQPDQRASASGDREGCSATALTTAAQVTGSPARRLHPHNQAPELPERQVEKGSMAAER